MNKQYTIQKITALFFFAFISFSTSAQDNASEDLDIQGTYTIYVNSLKNAGIELTEEQKLELESKRLETEHLITEVDGISIRIMSRERMNSNSRWPLYTILNK